MKKTLTLIVIMVFSAALAQNKVVFTDSSKDLMLSAKDFSLTQMPSDGLIQIYRFDLRVPGGLVNVVSKKEGIEFFAPHIVADLIAIKNKEASGIRSATASGGMRAIRTATGARSEITGSSATYTATGSTPKIEVSGPVRLTDSQGTTKSFVATGRRLRADFRKEKSANPLSTADLDGPVQITIKQAARGKTPAADATVNGQHLRLNRTAKPATITITGDVKVRGVAGTTSVVSGLKEIILTLNDKDQVIRTEGKG
jgi:hypothetical protein